MLDCDKIGKQEISIRNNHLIEAMNPAWIAENQHACNHIQKKLHAASQPFWSIHTHRSQQVFNKFTQLLYSYNLILYNVPDHLHHIFFHLYYRYRSNGSCIFVMWSEACNSKNNSTTCPPCEWSPDHIDSVPSCDAIMVTG